MADNAPWLFFMSQRDELREMRGLAASNAAMVEDLVHSGSLKSPECIAAFQAVDRQHFWPADSGELAYADMPLRSGRLHLSAPHIYAKAMESLMPLRPGMSFLNVGSGTGYFNSIVSELVGPLATNHGIDIWLETITHASQCCRLLGKHNIELTLGNAYQLNVNMTMRYDRIYLGACANSRSKYLYRLLEVGGVLIGPFQVGHTQQLRRVVRRTETQFNVEVLGSVQFASLVEPPAETCLRPQSVSLPPVSPPGILTPGTDDASQARRNSHTSSRCEAIGLPGVPFTFSLCERPWTPDRCWLYPASFKRTVAMGLMCRPRNQTLPCLPTEIWVKHIFPWCPKWWFEAAIPQVVTIIPQKASSNDTGWPPAKSGDETEQSDDGASTRAPSSRFPSADTTPQAGPVNPPADFEADMISMVAEENPHESIDLSDVMVEVFGNGQRHTIGADDDPDDMEPDEGPRLVVPLRVLQLLAADARRRRRTREDMDPNDEDGASGNEDNDEEEDMFPEFAGGPGRASDDDEMPDVEDGSEAEVDEDADTSDMVML